MENIELAKHFKKKFKNHFKVIVEIKEQNSIQINSSEFIKHFAAMMQALDEGKSYLKEVAKPEEYLLLSEFESKVYKDNKELIENGVNEEVFDKVYNDLRYIMRSLDNIIDTY